jgi:sugar phosphate isomerase/epimerase
VFGDLLVLSAHTVPHATWTERLDAAVAGGFGAIGLRLADIRAARAEHADADLRAGLADRGLVVAEVDVLWEWALGGDRGERSRRAEGSLVEAAVAVGARTLNAVSELDGPTGAGTAGRDGVLDAAAARFAALCDRVAEHGLAVHVEYMPWSTLGDLATAWEVVRRADRSNGGIMVDAWHHYRGPGDDALLATLPPSAVLAVQVDDALADPEPDPVEETLHRRQVPGEGALDLVGFVRTLLAAGVDCPVGCEVFSDELYALPPAVAARRAGDGLRAVLAAAGI